LRYASGVDDERDVAVVDDERVAAVDDERDDAELLETLDLIGLDVLPVEEAKLVLLRLDTGPATVLRLGVLGR
jgi:hypothetical protein